MGDELKFSSQAYNLCWDTEAAAELVPSAPQLKAYKVGKVPKSLEGRTMMYSRYSALTAGDSRVPLALHGCACVGGHVHSSSRMGETRGL